MGLSSRGAETLAVAGAGAAILVARGAETVAVAGACAAVLVAVWRLWRRVADLEARDQMKEFASYYTRGIDRLDADLIQRAFLAGATVDIPNLPTAVPVAELSVGVIDFLGKQCVMTQHCLSNHVFVFAADRAAARSEIYFVANHWKLIDGVIQNAGVNGRYLDEWTKGADGVFRIAKRKLLYDFQGALWNESVEAGAKAGGHYQKPNVARPANIGSRDKNDFSYQHLAMPVPPPSQ